MIRVIQPRLTPTAQLIGHLEKIDASQIYANGGPCLAEFEGELATHLHLTKDEIACVSNGTTALLLSMMAFGKAGYCLMPAWNFTAVPAAALLAGMTPYFVDVETPYGVLTPEIAKRSLRDDVRCVVAVSPFGIPLDPRPWDDFTRETGIPVVIDGAGMFDSVTFSKTPVIVSLHVTKCFGIGEGGFIGSTDPSFMEQIRLRRDFGMDDSRYSLVPGFNGKMSEYAAAIGLAQWEDWPRKRTILREKALRYARHISLYLPNGYGQDWLSGNLVIYLPRAVAHDLSYYLASEGIETRFWWRSGCHLQKAYESCPRLLLPNTEHLAESTLGLPFGEHLSDQDIDFICEKVLVFLEEGMLLEVGLKCAS